MDVEEISSVLSDQREEIVAAKTLDADLDFAFNLQIQEAINASLNNSHQSNASTSHCPPPRSFTITAADAVFAAADAVFAAACTAADVACTAADVLCTAADVACKAVDVACNAAGVVFDYTDLLLEDLNRFDQERRDRDQCEAEMKRMRRDLDRRIHDQKVANEIKNIPDAEWENYGDNFERPYNFDDDDDNDGDHTQSCCCKLYFKGVVSEEWIRDTRVVVAAIGIAICDPRDNLMFEMRKGLDHGERVSSVMAELEALVEGLNVAMSLNLERVSFLVDDYTVYQYVTLRLPPNQSKIATLVNQVAILQQKFAYCQPSLVARNDIKFAFKFAKDAIVSQITWPVETRDGTSLKETCVICFEDTDVAQMFSVDGCLHRYCFPCMKQHVEVKLLNGTVAKCPHEGCKSDIDIDSCAKFLDPRLVEIMSNRMKEAAIAVTEKVYCPYPRCSALMSNHEVLDYTKSVLVDAERSGARKCTKCHRFFCIDCKVPWHYNMTCQDYKRLNPQSNPDDAMVKSLAQKKLWRQCVKCNHLVELAEGCYHITCRCGHEFCYICGAEWKNKKPTCTCPIWDERNIIRDRQGRRQ